MVILSDCFVLGNKYTDGDLTLRKEIAQQAEHQAKDSDKWRELESVTCSSTRVIFFILSNLPKQTRTSPKTP